MSELKAYRYDREDWDTSYIYFVKTRNEARYLACMEFNDEPYTKIRVTRESWADKYGSFEKIPFEELIKHGWSLKCSSLRCDETLDEDTAFFHDGFPYCERCFNEVTYNERKNNPPQLIYVEGSLRCSKCAGIKLPQDSKNYCSYCGSKLLDSNLIKEC